MNRHINRTVFPHPTDYTMELSQQQLHRLLQRFPLFELSYETLTHKKVPSNYDICLGVPAGRKYFMWHTFYRNKDVCYLMELNKDKRIVRATVTTTDFARECHIGTILYGSLVCDQIDATSKQVYSPFFVIEDIYFYKGIPLKHVCFAEKAHILKKLFEDNPTENRERDMVPDKTPVYLPYIWHASKPQPVFPYTVHHIQYRESSRICPYLNVIYGLRESISTTVAVPALPTEIYISQYTPEYGKPQYKYPTVFRVMADIQYDIYHLYACGQPTTPNNLREYPLGCAAGYSSNTYAPTSLRRSPKSAKSNNTTQRHLSFVYYDVAYIPNYTKSVFMNGLFRNIRENRNLDYIEESDDEEDFENTREDKYVHLNKELFMECSFHTKFKRWVPIRVVDKRDKVVHISKLAR